jgi:myo-inositol-1(or 4)-monophosphatase
VSETDAELGVRAAQAGSAVVRALYGRQLERFAKSVNDFATEADVAAERAIRDVLRDARPEDGFVGEELGSTGATAGRTWLVDPLCGTLNYAARTPLAAVNVALRVGDRIVAAAVAEPFSGDMFWTDGRTAHVRSDGRDKPLVPDPASRLVDVNLDPPFPNGDRFRTARMLQDETFVDRFHPRVLSTTLALAWVAAGRHAAYVSDGDLRDSVHFSSGIALCQAAGCVVTGLAGQPVHTGAQGLIAAADTQTHADLVAIISRHLGKRFDQGVGRPGTVEETATSP